MMLSADAQREEFDVMEMGASALLELAMGGIFTPTPKDAKSSAVAITPLENPKPSCLASASAPRQSRSTVLREDPAPKPKACLGTRRILSRVHLSSPPLPLNFHGPSLCLRHVCGMACASRPFL